MIINVILIRNDQYKVILVVFFINVSMLNNFQKMSKDYDQLGH